MYNNDQIEEMEEFPDYKDPVQDMIPTIEDGDEVDLIGP